MPMRRVEDSDDHLAWLADRPEEEATTGYDADGWSSSIWILHAMYENTSLRGLGTHDEIHKRRLDAGDVAPLLIGDVNLDEGTTVTGTSLGYVVHPGQPWQRLRWADLLADARTAQGRRDYPPCFRWFPYNSWPVSIEPPPEGSLDEDSMTALLAVLADQSTDGMASECFAFFASIPAGDFDATHLWRGPLSAVPDLIDERGGPYPSSPTNLWPNDKSWFVWTDWDLQGTKVSGSADLIDALESDAVLETRPWPTSP